MGGGGAYTPTQTRTCSHSHIHTHIYTQIRSPIHTPQRHHIPSHTLTCTHLLEHSPWLTDSYTHQSLAHRHSRSSTHKHSPIHARSPHTLPAHAKTHSPTHHSARISKTEAEARLRLARAGHSGNCCPETGAQAHFLLAPGSCPPRNKQQVPKSLSPTLRSNIDISKNGKGSEGNKSGRWEGGRR